MFNLKFLIGILSYFLIIQVSVADTPTISGQVIPSQSFIQKQVGGGKAVIEIFKEGKNAFIGRLTLAPHGKVPKHRDPTEEYLLIESGRGHITIDGKKTLVKAGDFIYMPALAEVSFKNGDQPLIALQIFAGPQSARKYDQWQTVKSQKN